jgi:hypothetical protein
MWQQNQIDDKNGPKEPGKFKKINNCQGAKNLNITNWNIFKYKIYEKGKKKKR